MDSVTVVYSLIVGVFGLIMGSFVTAFTWRFKHKKNWVSDRSRCVACKHILAPRDLVPIVSWVMNGRRCRFCKKSVSWQYPAIEVATGTVFALSYALWPFEHLGAWVVIFGLWLVLLTIFSILTVYDIRHMLLPNPMVLAASLVAFLYAVSVILFGKGASVEDITLWQPFLSAGALAGLFWAMFQVSAGSWIGGGDVKLAVPLGLAVLKPELAAMVLLFASLFGTLFGLGLIIVQKKSTKTRIPFGPMLMSACVIVVLFGESILNWYLGR